MKRPLETPLCRWCGSRQLVRTTPAVVHPSPVWRHSHGPIDRVTVIPVTLTAGEFLLCEACDLA